MLQNKKIYQNLKILIENFSFYPKILPIYLPTFITNIYVINLTQYVKTCKSNCSQKKNLVNRTKNQENAWETQDGEQWIFISIKANQRFFIIYFNYKIQRLLLFNFAQSSDGRSDRGCRGRGINPGTTGYDPLAAFARPDANATAFHRFLFKSKDKIQLRRNNLSN